MKLTRFASFLACAALLSLISTGCKHHPPGITPLPGEGVTGQNPGVGPGGTLEAPGSTDTSSGIPSNPAGAHDGWTPNAEVFQADTVHFAFDSSVIRPEDSPKLAAVADYLKANPSAAAKIEGHCDERGTEEYNRALGERRALALREELVRLGIDPTRVDTISYGKDRPEDPGHNEAAWSKNRRGVFILLTPPKGT
ncbi:MAG TPA: OmpA family protein [Verrucomicrobiae bacterium]|nr:OmpA family protein [Verrucomicrobiae bacterium]